MIATFAVILFRTFVETSTDGIPIPSFFNFDWDAVGGWSLFIGLALFIVIGAFREWWVPGPRHRRVEASAAEQSKLLATTVDLLKETTHANEITKHFFEKTVPKRGEPQE